MSHRRAAVFHFNINEEVDNTLRTVKGTLESVREKKKYVGVPVEAFSSRPDTPWGERKRYDTSIRRLSHPAGREAKESGRISLNSRSTAVVRDRDRGSTDLSCRGSLLAGELPSREKRRSPRRNVAVAGANKSSLLRSQFSFKVSANNAGWR